MANELKPKAGAPYLRVSRVMELLAAEFDCMAVNHEEGQADADAMLAKLKQLNAPSEIVDPIAAGAHEAVAVVIAESWTAEHSLQFTVLPERPVFVGYYSGQQETAVRPLLERCAKALNYEIELL